MINKRIVLCLFAALIIGAGHLFAEQPKVLAYTRNGPTLDGKKGFVHDNIAANVALLKQLGKDNGFMVEVSDDPATFTDAKLKTYRVLIFANSNNQAFDNDEQREALKRYIHNGGGFVGIHSASGSERNWPWFWALLGGTFHFHAPLQKFPVTIVDKTHPATAFYPDATWAWEDEFYVMKEQPKDVRVLLTGNIKPLKMDKNAAKIADKLPDSVPLAWCHEFEGGRAFYTALGHKKEYYSDPNLQKHILGGILWAMGQDKKETK